MKKKAVQRGGDGIGLGARVLRVFSRYRASTRRQARSAVKRRIAAEQRGDPVEAVDANRDHIECCQRLQTAEELFADVFRAMARCDRPRRTGKTAKEGRA